MAPPPRPTLPAATPTSSAKPRRRLPGGLTNSALISGVVSAIVAGAISFTVAHYQDQDAAHQAISGQQVSAVLQLETAANAYYQAVFTLWASCEEHPEDGCTTETVNGTSFAVAQADRLNISDPRTSALAAQLANLSDTALEMVGPGPGQGAYTTPIVTIYQELMARCGQIIQGQA
jgi:hypothetical protein